MKAAGIERFGGTVKAIDLPEPRALAPDEVLIDVMAAGVGNWDEFARLGEWDIGTKPPMALGVEASGVITIVGDRVNRWSAGDAVMVHAAPVREQGAWSQRFIVCGELLARKPDGVSWEEAAAFPVPALTAEQALYAVGAGGGEIPILVNGAGGVTGGLVAALARLRGAQVIATASPRSVQRLQRLGIDAVIDYHEPDWPSRVRDLAGGLGVPAAVNAARGGEAATLSAVINGGRFATITGAPPTAERGVSIVDVYVRADGEQLRALAELFAQERLDLSVVAVHTLEQAAEALELVTHRGVQGAIVLRP